MKIVELTNALFDEFANTHPLTNYCQTSKYALFMSEYGYNYDYIGYVDEENKIYAATMILTKKMIGKAKYGYAPKGFLVNYSDSSLLKNFINDLRDYYLKKDYVFIKINPEIIIGEGKYNQNYKISYNGNVRLIDELKLLNVKRRMELQEFDLMQPRFNAYINLFEYDVRNLNRPIRKKLANAEEKGLSLVVGGAKEIDILYSFISRTKKNRPLGYYRNFYNVFNKDNSIDLVYVKIDYQKYLEYVKSKYEHELEVNDTWNNIIQTKSTPKNLNRKMNSDIKLENLKNRIVLATNNLKKKQFAYIAGALVIKHYNRVSIIFSGFDPKSSYLHPNAYLYHAILNRYKPYFNLCDIGGVSGVFTDESTYKGLNDFKLMFKPTVYEFIGEFDLICSEKIFKRLIKTSFIEDEFNRH